MNRFTASLHTHVRSIFDAQIDADELCKKIIEMGGKGCAITDHGVLSSIEDYRPVFAANGLKMIPGCELYVDGGILGRLHLVVLARNFNGYKAVCRMVTTANQNQAIEGGSYPVITQEQMFDIARGCKDDIFALSACVQGVLAAIFLQNKTVEDKIAKVKRKQEKYINPASEDAVKAETAFEKAAEDVNIAIAKRDSTKALAEMKFVQREKAIAKKEKAGEDMTAYRAELNSDKEKSEKAQAELEAVKDALAMARKKLTAANKAKEEVSESIDKFLECEDEIMSLRQELKSEEVLCDMAKNTAMKYLDAFGSGNFLAEVQYHGIEAEAECYPKVVGVAKELNIPLVATNDVHMLTNSPDDRLRRQILRSLRFGKSFEPENPGDEELYLKDNDELFEWLSKIISKEDAEAAINNIDVVFNACNVEFETGKHYPKYKEE